MCGGKIAGSNDRDICEYICKQLPEDVADGYQMGVTKVFLRETAERTLEELRQSALRGIVVILQKNVRRWLAERQWKRVRAAVLRLQAYSRMRLAKIRYRKRMEAVTKIQAFARMVGVPLDDYNP